MILRRLLAVALAVVVAWPAAAQHKWYASGTKERAVQFAGANGVMLSGTLLLPLISEIQHVPGVVLIAGSGPTDRNGNNSLIHARIDTLKLIAERLAEARIATLRYDKRGIGASTPTPRSVEEQERFFTWENLVGDAQAAQAELLRHDEIKPYATALLGHSEGGDMAIAAAAGARVRPHAIVLASTPGLPLQEIIRRQLARHQPALVEPADRAMAAIRATGRVPVDIPPALAKLFPAYVGPYLQGALAFDPAQALAALDIACLLVHGAADRQVVPLADIQPLLDVLGKRGAPGEAFIAPGVSHNLKAVFGPTSPGLSGPLAPAIGDKIASWLAAVLGA